MKSDLSLDKQGYLLNLSDWTPEVAEQLAANETIRLTTGHWEIIYLVRDYYEEYQIAPITRVLVRHIGERLGRDKGNSIYLMKLFGGKPAGLVSKVSGLPKPANCD